MKTFILIACASTKLPHRAKAKDLYVSTLFRLSLRYAEQRHPDGIFILSANHGLLDLEQQIEPYDLTLNRMNSGQVQAWAAKVLAQINERADPSRDHFVLLAGVKYRKFLIPALASCDVPMKGLTIGMQLQFLVEHTHV